MPGSYEKVNFAIRPAKCIERKMLCEAFQRLREFGPLERYRYIGFGSTYFADFILFHKVLGLRNMVSIEADRQNRRRFAFNKPFRCIRMRYGWSNEQLPELAWGTRSIVWLDYDYALDESVLADVRLLVSRLTSGSLAVFTVDARPPNPRSRPRDSLAEIRGRLPSRIPAEVGAADLDDWGTAKVYRQVIHNEVEQALSDRNGVLDVGHRLTYTQLFNFHYEDGAKMLTVGGLLHAKRHEPSFTRCNFDALSFLRTGDEPCVIEVPNLTYRELRHLDRQLPSEGIPRLRHPGIPRADVTRYSEWYRYFPTFAETEL